MNKILNVPENFVSETLEGILLASNQKLLSMDKDNRVIVSNYPCKPNKVGIVTAGGSGHLPTFLGYVGKGMLPHTMRLILFAWLPTLIITTYVPDLSLFLPRLFGYC